MEVFSGRSASTLNPYAAPFVPGTAYRAARDLSPEWWKRTAVAAPPLRESPAASQAESPGAGGDYLDRVLPDADSLFHCYTPEHQEAEEWKPRETIAWGPRGRSDGSWYFQEAPRIANTWAGR